MRRIPALLVCLAACTNGLAVAEPPPGDRVDAGPTTPAFTTADGVEVTLFASEPMLSSPTDIDVDARGRVWVCEVTNYRDRRDERVSGDRILVLEDTDHDGRADSRTIFHQGRDVDSALGICVIGEGPGRRVIVSCAPEVFVLHDDDGDLVADRKELLFTKTGQPQHDHSTHAFVVGPDGRLYFNFGNAGGSVHDAAGRAVIDRFGNRVDDAGRPFRQGMVFRCTRDGRGFEVLGWNFRNPYEVAVDSFGGLWQSDNDDDGHRATRVTFVMEYGNYGFVDERTGAGWQAPRTNIEPEIPDRHWHQHDPGVVPNLLVTGNGSPAGLCVYEAALLPGRFHGAVIHCDAGPRVLRAYRVAPHGAGYRAESQTLVDGAVDAWFRPVDVCTAPDGSLLVADWHDPGVGGHAMADTEKGRIYRVAATGSGWTVPAVGFGTPPAAVAALASPNLCTRATALEALASWPAAALCELASARAGTVDPRLRARLAWAASTLPGCPPELPETLAAETDEMQVVAVRMQRFMQGDVLGLVERLAASPSAAVRRECALALRGVAGPRADRAWAKLAARHEAGDRWDVEALGIGADCVAGFGETGAWDGRLAAWLETAGDRWRSPAGREIVWRSRAAVTPKLLCDLIGDPSIDPAESLALVRALDFQQRAAVVAAVRPLVEAFEASLDTRRSILPELVGRLDEADLAAPGIATRLTEALDMVAGTRTFVDLVGRFHRTDRVAELVALATAEGTSEAVASAAAGTALGLGGGRIVAEAIDAEGPEAERLLLAIGLCGDDTCLRLLDGIVAEAGTRPVIASAAVAALARSNEGARDLVTMAKAGRLAGPLPQAAAVAIAACPWADVRQAAIGVLPMPVMKGGELPPLAELLRRDGRAERGEGVFTGAGTCARCHVVRGQGRNVGPDLSGIGTKLSRRAIYEAILAPSAAVSHGYEACTALRHDGRSVTGLLVSRTDAGVVIRGADGNDVTISNADLDDLVKHPVSLMPADLAAALTADELVDLVAWLETLKSHAIDARP